MLRRRIVPIVTVGTALSILLVVLASCSINQAAAPPPAIAPSPPPTSAATNRGAQDQDALFQEQSQVQRLVIKNAILQIVVPNPQDSLATIGKMAEDMGGWVVTSSAYQTKTRSGVTVTQATTTIRVPSQRLSEALQRIKDGAESVQTETVSGQDVTQDYVDLQSKLTNLEAAETQLRKIMDSATKTDDVLVVYRELVQVRGDIEVTKGRMKYYEQSAAFSSIQLTLIPTEQEKPLEIAGWSPLEAVKGAFAALVNTLQGVVNVLIWLAVLVTPLLIVFGIPALLIVRALRRRAPKATAAAGTTAS
jgi:uncharacterized protein DUF4349